MITDVSRFCKGKMHSREKTFTGREYPCKTICFSREKGIYFKIRMLGVCPRVRRRDAALPQDARHRPVGSSLKEVFVKYRLSNEMGEVVLDTDVVASYAGTIAIECFGIVGMASISMTDGLVKLLKKDSLAKGINVTIVDDQFNIDFHVIVSYGVNIGAVSDNLMETVRYKVQEFTGVPVGKINIYVEGVRVID